ncbi:MarR family winged helix-turn-helix transcriptional regulator [Lacrimispora brassicae]
MDCNFESKDQECKLNGCLFFTSAKLAREMGRMADEAFSKTGLSPSHGILLYIVNLRGGIQQKEIGETLHLTPSTITRLLERLERKGLIAKKAEGKNVYLCTTPEGLAMQSEIITAWNMLQDEYKDVLTEEETARFIEISSKLLKSMDDKKMK